MVPPRVWEFKGICEESHKRRPSLVPAGSETRFDCGAGRAICSGVSAQGDGSAEGRSIAGDEAGAGADPCSTFAVWVSTLADFSGGCPSAEDAHLGSAAKPKREQALGPGGVGQGLLNFGRRESAARQLFRRKVEHAPAEGLKVGPHLLRSV